jgi:CheY-like chemotaxis protein
MRRFGSGRRPKTERELARSVKGILEWGQPLEYGFLVEKLTRIGGDRLELRERPAKAPPQTGKRCYVPLALPTRDARSHSAILALQCPRQMGGAGHTVLVVDDDDSLRMLCRINLELEGYHVLEAPTVETAQQLLRDEEVDVVLLDVHVGSGDGFSVLGDLGAERVALFTGSFQIDERRAAAVDAVLKKPFTIAELSETVGRLAVAVR